LSKFRIRATTAATAASTAAAATAAATAAAVKQLMLFNEGIMQ
jgi:hypothetical protein